MATDIKHVVLLSGGWESTYCALSAPKGALLLFIDYGQPYSEWEMRASARIATLLDAPGIIERIDTVGASDAAGVFPDRNKILLRHARQYGEVLWFGCRGRFAIFDRYGDSNRQFADNMEKQLGCRIVTPCVNMPKFMVRRGVRRMLTDRLIYSSEGL